MDQELPTKIPIFVGREMVFKVEYVWLPVACKRCKVFGHGIGPSSGGLRGRNTPANINLGSNAAGDVPTAVTSKTYGSASIDLGGRLVDSDEHIIPLRVNNSTAGSGSMANTNKELVVFVGPNTASIEPTIERLEGERSKTTLLVRH